MLRRFLLVVDLLLVVLAGTLGIHLYRVWTAAPTATAGGAASRPAGAPPTGTAAAGSAPAGPASAARTGAPAAAPLTAFAVVAERNLFSQTRAEVTEAPKPSPSAGMPPVAAGPKPRLFGVVVLGGGEGARAYLEDPRTRKVFGYAVGDTVADSRVEEIKTDRVVLRRGAEVFEVLLRDPSKPRAPAIPTLPGAIPQVPGAMPGAPPFPGQVPGGIRGPQAVPVIPGGEPVDPGVPGQPGMPTSPGFTGPFPVPGQQPFVPRPQTMPQTPPPTAGGVPRRLPGQPTVPRDPSRPYLRPQPRGDSGS